MKPRTPLYVGARKSASQAFVAVAAIILAFGCLEDKAPEPHPSALAAEQSDEQIVVDHLYVTVQSDHSSALALVRRDVVVDGLETRGPKLFTAMENTDGPTGLFYGEAVKHYFDWSPELRSAYRDMFGLKPGDDRKMFRIQVAGHGIQGGDTIYSDATSLTPERTLTYAEIARFLGSMLPADAEVQVDLFSCNGGSAQCKSTGLSGIFSRAPRLSFAQQFANELGRYFPRVAVIGATGTMNGATGDIIETPGTGDTRPFPFLVFKPGQRTTGATAILASRSKRESDLYALEQVTKDQKDPKTGKVVRPGRANTASEIRNISALRTSLIALNRQLGTMRPEDVSPNPLPNYPERQSTVPSDATGAIPGGDAAASSEPATRTPVLASAKTKSSKPVAGPRTSIH